VGGWKSQLISIAGLRAKLMGSRDRILLLIFSSTEEGLKSLPRQSNSSDLAPSNLWMIHLKGF